MSLREQWKFHYPAHLVQGAARKLLNYHEGKIAYWLQKVKEAEVAARESVTLRQATGSMNGQTAVSARPQMDEGKMQALYEAQRRLKYHQEQSAQYFTWVGALENTTTPGELDLDYDDLVYFGLAPNKSTEDEEGED